MICISCKLEMKQMPKEDDWEVYYCNFCHRVWFYDPRQKIWV